MTSHLILLRKLNWHFLIFACLSSYLIFSVPADSQQITLDLGEGASLSHRSVQLIAVITLLSLVPAIAMMFTCFPFMVTVLAILRQGIGLQQSPPNMLIVSLAIFLTFFVMEPVFKEAWTNGLSPFIDETLSLEEGVEKSIKPFKEFMSSRVSLETVAILADLRSTEFESQGSEIDLSVLIPSFLLSEIERAFQIGFLIYIPFLVIDLSVAAILMSMGMMMVPPVIVSLPFKLAFFVVADGWSLISTALVVNYI